MSQIFLDAGTACLRLAFQGVVFDVVLAILRVQTSSKPSFAGRMSHVS